MNQVNDNGDSGLISCATCLKEIPVSEANSEEASDYVAYYCGLECYAEWKKQNDNTSH